MLGLEMDVDVRRTSELDDTDWTELDQLNERANGTPAQRRASPTGRLSWAGRDDTRWALRTRAEDGRLVSSVYVTTRQILVNGLTQNAGGIRGVMTDPAYRRRGFARACMQRAAQVMFEDEQVDMGLLLSSAMAVPLYASLGWQIFDGPVWCDQPETGRINSTERLGGPPMVLLQHGGATSGTIDMCGLPW
jgi:GNAT superfamily N-acetyltransferase